MPPLIGGYERLSLIGDGAMGAVYLGRDPRFDRRVAIKVLHPQLQRDPAVVERFKSEAVIQAKLSHPNIVTVYDFVAEADTLAIVMEFVDGPPLSDVIARSRGPMPPARAAAIAEQVLSALAHAHMQGLVHRDIKPSNVLLATIVGEEVAKLADFGIAKILGSGMLRTSTGAKMGTLAYMSPEQVKSPKSVDARSDIYSVAVVLYEMLTGRVPFTSDSEYEVLRAIIESPVPAPRALSPAIPAALEQALGRALAKSPADRFPDALSFRDAIRRSFDGGAAARSGAVVFAPGASSAAWPGSDAREAPGLRRRLERSPGIFAGLAIAAALVFAIAVVVLSAAFARRSATTALLAGSESPEPARPTPVVEETPPPSPAPTAPAPQRGRRDAKPAPAAAGMNPYGFPCVLDPECYAGNHYLARDPRSGECVDYRKCSVIWKCPEGPRLGTCSGGMEACAFGPICEEGVQTVAEGFCTALAGCGDQLKIR